MSIVIFEDLTTEKALVEIEKESSKYDGLYVDMEDKEQRKFVKSKASLIGDLLKKLERARIDKTKDYKAKVEEEAARIKLRLEEANKPFTSLIDEYKKERAKILAEQKAAEEARQLAIQIELDHEEAITLDKIRTFEIEDAIRQKKERDERIAKEAAEEAERQKELAEERAEEAEKQKILLEAKAKRDAEQAKIEAEERVRLAAEQAKQAEIQRQKEEEERKAEEQRKIEANKKHVGAVRKEVKKALMDMCKLDEKTAKSVVMALLKIDRVTINY